MGSSSDKAADVVTLKGMRFHARIGVLPHEAEIAQSIEVDASLWVHRSAAKITAKNIVDYRRGLEPGARRGNHRPPRLPPEEAGEIAARPPPPPGGGSAGGCRPPP